MYISLADNPYANAWRRYARLLASNTHLAYSQIQNQMTTRKTTRNICILLDGHLLRVFIKNQQPAPFSKIYTSHTHTAQSTLPRPLHQINAERAHNVRRDTRGRGEWKQYATSFNNTWYNVHWSMQNECPPDDNAQGFAMHADGANKTYIFEIKIGLLCATACDWWSWHTQWPMPKRILFDSTECCCRLFVLLHSPELRLIDHMAQKKRRRKNMKIIFAWKMDVDDDGEEVFHFWMSPVRPNAQNRFQLSNSIIYYFRSPCVTPWPVRRAARLHG